jgi:hypothetical protein
MHRNVQRDHLVNNILGEIEKGVTTRSHVANFYEHYSIVSSFEPFNVEDTPRDLDWVVAMEEELNNFNRNEVWYLVERPKINIVGTKWVFHNKKDEHRGVTRNKARLVVKGTIYFFQLITFILINLRGNTFFSFEIIYINLRDNI